MTDPAESHAPEGETTPPEPDADPTDRDAPPILFGDIAMAEGIINQDQLEEAVKEQQDDEDPLPLGEILLRKEFLLPEQLRRILEIQETRLEDTHETTIMNLGESFFGRKVIDLGLASEDDVDAALRIQGRCREVGDDIRLGQVLVEAGSLTPDQVREVLQQQNREVLFCQECCAQYNIVGYEPGYAFQCQACDAKLVVPDPEKDPNRYRKGDTPPPGGARSRRAGDQTDPTQELFPLKSPGEIKGETFGDYVILKKVAQGGMGIVYQAIQRKLDRIVALKVLKSGHGATKEDLQRFHMEAIAAANLTHPAIVQIHDVGEVDGRHYLTMDYVRGRSLSRIIQKGGLPVRDALVATMKVAEALDFAHRQGIVHRDIKPANILIDETQNPRITDFGLVKDLRSDTQMTRTGEVMGTPAYMSPEQAMGDSQIDGRTDVYSLGAVLYEMITSRPPFESSSTMDLLFKVVREEPVRPKVLNPSLHKDVETICLKALEKDPAKRYASAGQMAQDIERYLNGETIIARPVSWPERQWRRLQRDKRLALTAIGAGIIVIVALGYAITKEVGTRTRVREYMDAGWESMRTGDLVTAFTEFDRALSQDPENEEAALALENVVRIKHERRDDMVKKGNLYLEMRKLDTAKLFFEEALKLDDNCLEAHEGVDAVQEFQVEMEKVAELRDEAYERLKEGTRLVAEAKEMKPDEATRRYVDAVILIRQAVAKDPAEDPGTSETRRVLFDVLLEFADLSAGRKKFDMASYILSEAAYLGGDPARLRKTQDTLEFRKREHEGHTEFLAKGREALADGDFDSAIPAIHQALEIAETEEARETLARAYYDKGMADGDRMAKEGVWEDALEFYRMAREHATGPDLEIAEGKCDKALEEFSSPLISEAKDLWGEGKTQEATGLLKKVLAVNAGHSLARRMVADLERTEQAPEGTLYVPGGEFAAASDTPGKRRFLVSFYMSRHEVTNREYAEFLEDGGYDRQDLWDAPGWAARDEFTSKDGSPGPEGWTGGVHPDGMADHPVVGVSFYEARAYARWKGARLPYSWEWEKAASGDDDDRRKYPWGDAWDPAKANLSSTEARPVGEVEEDQSPYGVRDLGGNVNEWTVGEAGVPVIKGGTYLFPLERYARCSFRGTPPGAYRSPGTGFRCVRDLRWGGRP